MFLRSLRISLLMLLAVVSAYSQFEPQSEEKIYKIHGISVEGNVYANTETIVAISGLRVGDELKMPFDEKLQNAINNIWGQRQFADVDIVAERIVGDGVLLLIKVEEFPRLHQIEILGNEELSDEDIKEAIGKVRGDYVSKYAVHLAEKAVKKLYSEEGLTFAKVNIRLEGNSKDLYKQMIVEVEEGIEFKVRSIVFEGNEELEDDDLAGAFEETHEKKWWKFWKSSKFNKFEYEKDKELLSDYLEEKGFIDAEILEDTLIYDEEDEQIDVRIKIYEGPKVYVRNIDFKGNTIYTGNILSKRLGFDKGDVYDTKKFEMNLNANEDQTDVSSAYLDNGYLMARFDPQINRITEDSVDITINVYENDRFTIRKVKIIGNDKTKDKVIRRELYTKPGDYFNRSAVIRSVRALGVLNYFNQEKLQPDVQPVDNTRVDVVYKVEEQSTDTFNMSVGFAGSFGLTGSVGFSFNNFSIFEPLRGGAGQLFNFNWQFGQFNRYQSFNIGFTEPWLFDTPTTVGFNVFDTRYRWNFDQRRTGFALNIGRRFHWPDDYWRGDWGFRYQINDISTYGSSWYLPGKNTEITISQRLSRLSINHMFFPSSGSKFELSNSFAMGALGLGSIDYLKTELNYEMYNPIFNFEGSDRVVMMLGTKIGYIAGLEANNMISPIELFYMGGNGLSGFAVTPLRGYPDRSIGNDYGNRIMTKYTAEIRFAITLNPMPIYFYGFAEAGNVWDELKFTDPFNLKRSAGVGVQMFVNPIGILGFSYGYGFDRVNDGIGPSGWRFLFHLGQQ